MAEVKVLLEGYASTDTGGHSCSTITLVKDKGMNILVDPGTLKSQDIIKEKLGEHDMTTGDIDIVFITHSHMDHYRNIGMFPRSRVLDYWGWWESDVWRECDGKVTDDITVIKTPGHSYDSVTLVVKTENGTVAICGDVFWKKDYPEKDNFASEHEQLTESRRKVLEISDYVIPGHGGMYAATD